MVLAIVACPAYLRAKYEGGSRRDNHDVEVHQVLDCEITESPNLACQLLVFNDRQLIIGLPRMMFEGL